MLACPTGSKVIALSTYWQGNASPGPYCGRNIQITNTGGGSDNNGQGTVITATVKDTCPSCDENHLGAYWSNLLWGMAQMTDVTLADKI